MQTFLTPSNTKMAAEMFEKLSNLFTSSVSVKAEEDDEEEESEEEEEVTLNIVTSVKSMTILISFL